MADGFMGSIVVSAVQPVGDLVANFLPVVEHVAVQYLSVVGLVNSLDTCLLCSFARLDVLQVDALAVSTRGPCVGDELRAVVQADRQCRYDHLHLVAVCSDDVLGRLPFTRFSIAWK